MGNENDIELLNIQPQAGVIGVFSRLNYKAWYAIGEFVDNSTQSFYSHQEELKLHGIEEVEININYDVERDILTITDTAFGMERYDFARAVKVDSPPENKNGRNEFGMGLKTAASWFGTIW
ncbi:MAG: ATP-binding protein, partial [Bacteroidaceae bacterium]|nr:ATP-binding protein [Bacteroidaceae bacterium]